MVRSKQPKRREGLQEPSSPAYSVAPKRPIHRVLEDLSSADVSSVPVARAKPDALAGLSHHGYSEEEIWELVIPRRTLARRFAANEPLTVEETDKALRLQRIAVHAERVFGDPEKAHRWLRKPKRALNGETPVAYLATEAGAREVEAMLNRIDHGMAA